MMGSNATPVTNAEESLGNDLVVKASYTSFTPLTPRAAIRQLGVPHLERGAPCADAARPSRMQRVLAYIKRPIPHIEERCLQESRGGMCLATTPRRGSTALAPRLHDPSRETLRARPAWDAASPWAAAW